MKIAVFCEWRWNELLPVSLELLARAHELAGKEGEVLAFVIGIEAGPYVPELARAGATSVINVVDADLIAYHPVLFPAICAALLQEERVDAFLVGATVVGKDLAATVAACLNTGCAADCIDLKTEADGTLQQIAPAFSGNLMAVIITPRHRPQVATIKPGVFAPSLSQRQEKILSPAAIPVHRYGKAETVKCLSTPGQAYFPSPLIPAPLRLLTMQPTTTSENQEMTLTRAPVVVAGGAGVNEAEGWKMLHELARKLKGAVGATRPAVDAGLAPESYLIGQSGLTIRPRIYIAVGISGDLQHMVGVQEAGIIIAINKDPRAPIFTMADYGILGDYREVLPQLIQAAEALGSS